MLLKKFSDPKKTLDGSIRASVTLGTLETLWFNTGTTCDLSCHNCYIESTPINDRLSFLNDEDIRPYINEMKRDHPDAREIGLTGGEPFANPHIIKIIKSCLESNLQVIVLTNAYRLIKRYLDDLDKLNQYYPGKLLIRVSLDHYTAKVHEDERGKGTFYSVLEAMKLIQGKKIALAIAARSLMGEEHTLVQQGYQELLDKCGLDINIKDNRLFVIFPEIKTQVDIPEISTGCWDILKKSPDDLMCSHSRMVVKRKGDKEPVVLACTLLAYDKQFELGKTLKDSKKTVSLNHRFCAEFCVLGGASCS